MSKRNLYVSKADLPTWEAAEQFAKENHISLSTLVPIALRYLMTRSSAIGPVSRDVEERQQ